ncbi:MAG: biotin--[acetyl-CoA-carboxylase] ligase [Elusimicrobia bacterium GWC2_51_8]|nr:MAG: biotin--[acetyl-CoA-carboxylase] ligase [Elusimicrobia bacterium GWA2_51_34]OGR60188.1 MAG: biotin--[acetyl-CoA-carboxylase] ligase [Elusimicrobia bacterium GWC2_51_8]HAF96401.1 biotin--[acetyl-CoA-carboxylase] ligase [Elusimicrobiota bacterium]HCE98870.1 biotin--[acetyl-CoA-carboxylase] ligase [Elusimicrobiota bacterium]
MPLTVFNEDIKLEDLSGVRQLVRLEEIDSTQSVARELALEGNSECTLVLAARQTCGKGRMGRVWQSQSGGVYMTLILKPAIGLKYLPDLSVLGGEVVSSTLRELYGFKTRIKLPNDVYVFHPRKKKWLKIAGILTESASVAKTPNWILLGIGLNLNNKVPLDCAVSARELLGSEMSPADFLKAFFVNFWARYSSWEYSSRAKTSRA